ncbi:MAG: putative nucleic acid-binding protein [Limisphaerales bacterium]|jgi:predicted nucleic acid-binding protein
MPVVVSDSSPLIYLSKLDCFDLLEKLYGEIIVPGAVWREVADRGAHLPEGENAKNGRDAGWIKVVQVDPPLVESPPGEDPFGAGEAEAITLAKNNGYKLIIDELLGRQVARELGIMIIGTVAVFVEAKNQKLIEAVKPLLDRLRSETNFRLSEAIYQAILNRAGEDG